MILTFTQVFAQGSLWERNTAAAERAYQQTDYLEAEKQLLAALHQQFVSRLCDRSLTVAARIGSRIKAMAHSIPLAYLITFTCYGSRLHGDPSGSVDLDHNIPATPYLPANPRRVLAHEKKLKHACYELDRVRRKAVLQAIRDVCSHRGWNLFAAHVRSQHAHFVVSAQEAPEKVLNDVKAYASRLLNRAGLDCDGCKRWSRHGSTRYLWKDADVGAAIHYVVREQGEPMAVWENPKGLF